MLAEQSISTSLVHELLNCLVLASLVMSPKQITAAALLSAIWARGIAGQVVKWTICPIALTSSSG